jgi:hypothetical protein
VFAVIDLYGSVESISVISNSGGDNLMLMSQVSTVSEVVEVRGDNYKQPRWFVCSIKIKDFFKSILNKIRVILHECKKL